VVAKINSGTSIIGMLNYNENKASEGQAELIIASKYGREPEDLNFYQKLERLTHLAERNSRAKTNALHISLNFDVGENLSKEQLHSIASRYMEGIGFGEQPFLVYQHFDAGHPHLHIATTNIQPDGKRIDLHNLGKTKSEETRKAIEIEFNLVKAESKQTQVPGIRPIKPEKIRYGKTDTKRAITNVVNYLTNQYNYTNLAELNILLKQYNVIADRGAADTRMFQKGGLVYQALSEKNEKIGVPIKASTIYGNPTLRNLEQKFQENAHDRRYPKAMLKNILDKTFHLNPKIDKAAFINLLKKEQVDVIFRENNQGKVYGLNFIDHKNKAVFKGSDIAEHYSASKILGRLDPGKKLMAYEPRQKEHLGPDASERETIQHHNTALSITDILLPDKQYDEQIAGGFKRKKKRRLKR
jgi:hypothetical protein